MFAAVRVMGIGLCAASGLVNLTTVPAQAAFMVMSSCQMDVMVVEGDQSKSIDCTVTNKETTPIYVLGDFGFVVTLPKPDKSDKVTKVVPPHLKEGGTVLSDGKVINNSMIAAGGSDVLRFLLMTDAADVNPMPVDYGINIFDVLLDLYS